MFSLISNGNNSYKFKDWVAAPYGVNKACNRRQKGKTFINEFKTKWACPRSGDKERKRRELMSPAQSVHGR
jgi:hypothetical protein